MSLWSTQYVYVFSILVAIQSDYFPKLHFPLDLCNRGTLYFV